MMRSPSSASCTIRSRSRSERMTSASNRLQGLGVDERRTGGELRQLSDELPGVMRHDGFALVGPATLRDFYLAGKDHDQPGRNLARFHNAFARHESSGPRRSGAGVRCRPAS